MNFVSARRDRGDMQNVFVHLKRLAAFARVVLIVASASLGNAPFAMAGDAAARRVIGFSPSGNHFAFEQYTTLYDSLENIARIEVIDTRRDAFVKGTPVTMKSNEDGHDLPELRNEVMRKARLITDPLLVHDVGTHFVGKPSMELDEIGIYQMDPKPLATAQEITLPDGRKLALTITDKALGKASCYGAGGRGTYGDVIVTGMTLTLTIDGGPPMVLNDDSRLPKNRRCVTAYGIAEIYHHQAKDGAQTLAVLIETVDAHEFHAGPNRRLMAVTRRLP